MSELQEQLVAQQQASMERIPKDTFAFMVDETKKLKASGIEGRAVQDGEQAPDFTLSNHLGKDRNLRLMLKDGPVVVSFYRGGW